MTGSDDPRDDAPEDRPLGHGPGDSALAREIQQGKPFASAGLEAYLNLIRTADRLEGEIARFLKSRGITAPQYNVLRILRGAEPEGLPSLAVAERMVTRVPDVTRLLDRCAAKGWVTRERSARDGRVVIARITPDGLELLARIDAPLDAYHRMQIAHMQEDELVQLIGLLEKMRDRPKPDDAD